MKNDKKITGEVHTINLTIPKQELVFTMTEECNLNCSYCYLPSKNSGRKMNFQTAQKGIDHFLRNPQYFTAPQLVLDFMGGEPLLEVELMDRIMDYFKIEAYKRKHPWFDNYKVTFTTNGTLYRTEKVQKFVRKNQNSLSPAISIDGTEAKHDNARKYANGKGSYKDVAESARLMLKQLPYSTMKATFGRGDIKYFKESILHFLELGYSVDNIFANVAYEDLWEDGDDLLFEDQLVQLADYLIDNDICTSQNGISLFDTHIGKPYIDEHLAKHWCNAGHGVMIGVDGNFYPCIRFLDMAFSKNDMGRKIGDVENGLDMNKLRPFRTITIENISPKKCLECQVASGCNICSGQALAESGTGTIFSRPTHICKMHKARVRANNYFWKKLSEKEDKMLNGRSFPRELRVVNKKILNVLLSTDSPSICNYDTQSHQHEKAQTLPLETLEKYVAMANRENYYINYILPNHELDDSYKSVIASTKFQTTKPYNNEAGKSQFVAGETFVFNIGQPIAEGFSCPNLILHISKERLGNLKDYIAKLFSLGVLRINLVMADLPLWKMEDITTYQDVLLEVNDIIVEYFRKGQQRSLNALTDRVLLDRMNNCNGGVTHLTLAPNGAIYLCPAFYYAGKPPLKGTEEDFSIPDQFQRLLKLENAPICKKCDAYQCKRCHYFNITDTAEMNIPGWKQCVLSHKEREASRILQSKLVDEKLLPYPNLKRIVSLNYEDPLEIAKVW